MRLRCVPTELTAVPLTPCAQLREQRFEAAAGIGQRVLHLWRHLGVDGAQHESVGFQLTQLTGEHPRGDSWLSIMSLLAASTWAEFSFVRDSIRMSDSALSKQISTLEQAGYVTVDKTGAGRRSRTYVQLSKRGRKAFDAHVAALQAIVNGPAPHANAEPPEGPRARTTDTTSQQTTARHSS